MQTSTPIETLLKRDRALVIAGVVAVAAIAWGYTVYLAQSNADVGASMGMAAGNVRSWNGVDFALMFVMWAVMMVAMMVPSAAPMVLLFATVNRRVVTQAEFESATFGFGGRSETQYSPSARAKA